MKGNTDSTKKVVISKSQLNRLASTTKSESQLETMVCDACRRAKLEPLKFFSSFSTGWPDREILTLTGHTIWVEFKKPGGRYKRLQELNRNWLIRNDHSYFTLDTEEKCKWFIDTVIPLVT
jgi:hypothetical protein